MDCLICFETKKDFIKLTCCKKELCKDCFLIIKTKNKCPFCRSSLKLSNAIIKNDEYYSQTFIFNDNTRYETRDSKYFSLIDIILTKTKIKLNKKN